MSFINNLYEKEDTSKKFRLTRGMLILAVALVIVVIVIIIIIVSLLSKKEIEYTTSDFNRLEKRMEEEAPIYLYQKNIELVDKEVSINLKDMLTENGGAIDSKKTIAVNVCDGYVIAKKEESESYKAYIKCKDLYTTTGYLSNDTTPTSKKTTSSKDTTKPDIVLIGDPEITINVGEAYKDAGAHATDNMDGDITSKIKIAGNVDTSKEGTYTLTYSVTDNAGNKNSKTRKITVVPAPTSRVTTTTKHNVTTKAPIKTTTRKVTTKATTTRKPTTPPSITLYGNKVVTIYIGDAYKDPGYSAKDSLGNNITSSVNVTNNINTKVTGTYYVNYTVTDSYGNQASVTRTVVVKSNYVALSAITLSPNAVTLKKGTKKALTVYFNPTNATNKSVSWSSDNPSVATVSGGTVTAKAKGTAIITAKGADGKSAKARITVE